MPYILVRESTVFRCLKQIYYFNENYNTGNTDNEHLSQIQFKLVNIFIHLHNIQKKGAQMSFLVQAKYKYKVSLLSFNVNLTTEMFRNSYL